MVLYCAVPVRVTRGALVALRYTYVPPFIPLLVSLWNDLANPVFYDVGLAVSREGPMLFHRSKMVAFFLSYAVFPYTSFILRRALVLRG